MLIQRTTEQFTVDWNSKPTGCFLFSRAKLRYNVNTIREAFKTRSKEVEIAYSIKANDHPLVLKSVVELGLRAEVASHVEWKLAVESGFNPSQIIINCPFLSDDFIEDITKSGSLVQVDSMQQLDQLASLEYPFRIGFRFCFSTANLPTSRFGIEWSETNKDWIIKVLKNSLLKPEGIHSHYSLSNREADNMKERVETMCAVYHSFKDHFSIQYINVGGGFMGAMPAEMVAQFGMKLTNWEEYAEAILNALISQLPNERPIPALIIEPGMALVADTCLFLAEVLEVKQTAGINFVIINSSTTWLKPTGHQRNLHFEKQGEKASTERNNYVIVGQSCMEKDIVSSYNGILKKGDRLLFHNMGAYTLSFASDFIIGKPQLVEID